VRLRLNPGRMTRRGTVVAVVGLAGLAWAGIAAGAAPGPDAAWSFDEGSGSTITDSIGSLDGTIGGATRIVGGVSGGALRFDGGSPARIPTDPVIEAGTITVRVWVRGDPDAPPADGGVILADGAQDCGVGAWALVVDGGHVAVRYRESVGLGGVQTVTFDGLAGFPSLWDGHWHLVGFISDQAQYGSVALYGQGWVIGAAPDGHGFDRSALDATDLAIGGPADPCAGSGFNGDIDDLQIDDRIVSRDVIATSEPSIATTIAIESIAPATVDQWSQVTVRVLPLPLAPGSIKIFFTGDDGVERVVGNRALDLWDLSGDGRYSLAIKPEDGGNGSLRARFEPSLPQTGSETTSAVSVAKAAAFPHLGLQNTYIENEPIQVWVIVSSAAYVFPNGSIELWEQTADGPVQLGTQPLTSTVIGFESAAIFTLPPRPAGFIELFPRYPGGTAHLAADGGHQTVTVEPALVPGVVSINSGDPSTNDPVAEVSTPATGAVAIQIARRLDDVRFMDVPIPYAPVTTTWLTAPWYGDDQDGVRTIYVRWADALNRWSDWSTDTIVLDRGLASGVVTVDGGAAVTTQHQASIGVGVNPTDAASVTAVQLSNDGVTWSAPKLYAPTVGWTLAAGDGTRTVRVRWLDAQGRQSVSKSDSIVVDASGPIIGTVRPRVALGGRPGATVPVRFAWSATDLSGVGSYDVQLRTGSGTWTAIATRIASASLTRSLSPTTTYGIRVRGRDIHGTVGPWSAETRIRASAIQESSSKIMWRGSWGSARATAYWGGATRWSSRAGSTATLTFRGTGIAWVAPVGPTRGRAAVSIDGVVVATIDLHATTAGSARIVFERTWSAATSHVIRIRVLGTTGHPRVDVDGLIVLSPT